VDDDDSFAFGWTVGGGVEAKIADNWSARVEYIYADIEDDDMTVSGDDIDAELKTHIVRGGIAYHF
jgi:outer membrane immunogenic protein